MMLCVFRRVPAGIELRALITRPAHPASATGFRLTIGCDARRSPRNSFPAQVKSDRHNDCKRQALQCQVAANGQLLAALSDLPVLGAG